MGTINRYKWGETESGQVRKNDREVIEVSLHRPAAALFLSGSFLVV